MAGLIPATHAVNHQARELFATALRFLISAIAGDAGAAWWPNNPPDQVQGRHDARETSPRHCNLRFFLG